MLHVLVDPDQTSAYLFYQTVEGKWALIKNVSRFCED